MLNHHDWLQIEQAAAGCVSGTSDDWPDLVHAITTLTGQSLPRKSAAWLQGFCEGVLLNNKEIVKAFEPFRQAIEANDSDTLGKLYKDECMLFSLSNSYSGTYRVTFGNLRKLYTAMTPPIIT